MSSRKGQGWTIDYVVSLLIFTIAAILAVKVLSNNVVQDDFTEVKRDAVFLSNQLLKTGAPAYWNPSTVQTLGLTNGGNRVNLAKLEYLRDMSYSDSRSMLGITRDYAFYFSDGNKTISIGSECIIGSDDVTEIRTPTSELKKSAYYYKDETFLSAYASLINADNYDANQDEEVDSFYENLDDYYFVLMENPEIQLGGTLPEEDKRSLLEDWIVKGGKLFITENTGLNFTGVNFNETPAIAGATVTEDDSVMEFTLTRTIDDSDLADSSYASWDNTSTNYTVLAEYVPGGEGFVATWNYGSGRVHYFATANAVYKGGMSDVDFRDKIGQGIMATANQTIYDCTGMGSIDRDNIARIDRLVILNSKIAKMVVLTW